MTVEVTVWAAITCGNRLHNLFIRGHRTATRYVDDLLQITLLLYLDDQSKAHSQPNNSRPHIAR